MPSVNPFSANSYSCKTDRDWYQFGSNVTAAAAHLEGVPNTQDEATGLVALADDTITQMTDPKALLIEMAKNPGDRTSLALQATENFGNELVSNLKLYTPMPEAFQQSMSELIPNGCQVKDK